MIAAEIVKIGAKMMEMLSKADIKMEDWQYLKLYSDYEDMVGDGGKISYVVTELSERYGISEASVYRILRRFKRAVKT